jgi:hypothetical protein
MFENIFTRNRADSLRKLVIFFGIIVYIAMLGYSGAHNIYLMLRGVPDGLVILAIVGVISIEITAATLPLALHFWCYATTQRYVAFGFYGVDLTLIFMNVVIDFALVSHSNSTLPAWITEYLAWVVPGTPIVAGLGWTILFLLDPHQQEHIENEQLLANVRAEYRKQKARAAMQNAALAGRIAGKAASDHVRDAETILDLGPESYASVTRPAPPRLEYEEEDLEEVGSSPSADGGTPPKNLSGRGQRK